MRSRVLERWGPVGARRGGLAVAGPREDAMKPSLEEQAASAEGPWEECFELAVQLALRAGQVSASALLLRPGGVRGRQPAGRAARSPHHTHPAPRKVRSEVKSDQRGSAGACGAGPGTTCGRGAARRCAGLRWARSRAAGPCAVGVR